jgi:hypothetical protein
MTSFGLYDIFNYLIYSSAEYDKKGLAAYKSFHDYRHSLLFIMFCRASDISAITYILLCSSQRNQNSYIRFGYQQELK